MGAMAAAVLRMSTSQISSGGGSSPSTQTDTALMPNADSSQLSTSSCTYDMACSSSASQHGWNAIGHGPQLLRRPLVLPLLVLLPLRPLKQLLELFFFFLFFGQLGHRLDQLGNALQPLAAFFPPGLLGP